MHHIIYVPGPNALGCNTDVDLSLWVAVDYTTDAPDQQADWQSITLVDVGSHRAELSVGEVKMSPSLNDQDRLFESWYRNPANVKRLKHLCADHWNNGGAAKWEADKRADAELDRQESRFTPGPFYLGPDVVPRAAGEVH